MSALARRFLPRSLFGQIVGVVLISLACVMIIGPLCERIARSRYFDVADMDIIAERAAAVAALLRQSDAGQRQVILAAAGRAGMDFRIIDNEAAAALPRISPWRAPVGGLLSTLFPPNELPGGTMQLSMAGKPVLALPLDRDSRLIQAGLPDTSLTIQVVNPATYYFVAFLALLGLMSLFAIRAVTRPLKAISDAIEQAETNAPGPLFAERGSIEIVGLAQALNRMRLRLHTMLENRARMLRGVSHDLRTPLTRLRMRTERLEESPPRTAMLADIGHIESLIEETLDYLRYEASTEPLQRADIASVLQTVCAEFHDVGFAVAYDGPDRLTGLCKPTALARAVTNLCDNGVKFADHVVVSLSAVPNGVCILVRDDGPGLPEAAHARITEPFYKADAARAGAGQGFGLGLSIVADIVHSHRGTLRFEANAPSGLIVRVEIPAAVDANCGLVTR